MTDIADFKVPDGWVLVPVTPTTDMLSVIVHAEWPDDKAAGLAQQNSHGVWPLDKDPCAVPLKCEYELAVGQYKRMLECAPKPPARQYQD